MGSGSTVLLGQVLHSCMVWVWVQLPQGQGLHSCRVLVHTPSKHCPKGPKSASDPHINLAKLTSLAGAGRVEDPGCTPPGPGRPWIHPCRSPKPRLILPRQPPWALHLPLGPRAPLDPPLGRPGPRQRCGAVDSGPAGRRCDGWAAETMQFISHS